MDWAIGNGSDPLPNSRIPVRRLGHARSALLAVVALSLGTTTPAIATPAKTTRTTTRTKATTTKRTPTTKRPSVTTPRSTPTTTNPISDRAVRTAYDHFMDVRYALLQDARSYRTELAKVAVGDALTYWLDFYDGFRVGDHWTGKRDEMKAIDFRVIELSSTAAVVRVCEYESASPTVDKNGAVVPGSDKPWVDDSRLEFQFAGKRGWLLSATYRMQDVEGESECANGKA